MVINYFIQILNCFLDKYDRENINNYERKNQPFIQVIKEKNIRLFNTDDYSTSIIYLFKKTIIIHDKIIFLISKIKSRYRNYKKILLKEI